jgi:DNA-binding NarL/FixJ family response regulator
MSASDDSRDLRVQTFVGSDGREYAAIGVTGPMAYSTTLTSAEREVASMMVAGWSNAAIAKARRVSVSTVANLARSVLAKLHVSSRAELLVHVGPST